MWCWISENSNSKLGGAFYRFIEFYGPLIVAIVMNIICCGRVILYMKNLVSDRDEISFVYRLGFYPVILIFCWLPATIDIIQNLTSNNPIYVLQLLHAGFGNMQGFLDALIYGLTPSVKDEFLMKIKCCGKEVDEESLDANLTDSKQVISQVGSYNIELGNTSSNIQI